MERIQGKIQLVCQTFQFELYFRKWLSGEKRAGMKERWENGEKLKRLCGLSDRVSGICTRGRFLGRLADTLGRNADELRQLYALAVLFPDREEVPELEWEAFSILLSLYGEDCAPERIRWLAEKAEKEHWGREQVERQVQEERELIRFRIRKKQYEMSGY